VSKQITYFIRCKKKGEPRTWLEEIGESKRFEKPETDKQALSIAKEIIKYFNDTINEWEVERQLVSVEKHITDIIIIE
jgi:hypothetical protein